MMELSEYQIAAALIGLPTDICTDDFSYCSPQYHLVLIKQEWEVAITAGSDSHTDSSLNDNLEHLERKLEIADKMRNAEESVHAKQECKDAEANESGDPSAKKIALTIAATQQK